MRFLKAVRFAVLPTCILMSPVSSFTTTTRKNLQHCKDQSSSSLSSSASSNNDISIKFSPSSLQHLEDTELPDDYSRKWTSTKVKALATGLGCGVLLGLAGDVFCSNLLGMEETSILFAPIGIGAGWLIGGGKQVAEEEKPINGGYDRKLIADRPARLQATLDFLKHDTNIPLDISSTTNSDEARMKAVYALIKEVHADEYTNLLSSKCKQADRPQRLNPVYSRTLIDQYSYDASLNAIRDWMDSVDAALDGTGSRKPKFALVRPPSHHACRGKGMGGCLLNSATCAATYALQKLGKDDALVAILDIDAHHGNGIAHCIQDNPQIKYCSIHESISSGFLGRTKDDPEDPRSAKSEDQGPLGNILNINLPASTGWETGYKDALVNEALPFLTRGGKKPDILLVAAGFDALEADLTSKLMLQPEDYREIGSILRDEFESKVAAGLEGGYCWQNGELQNAIANFVEAWR